MLTDDQSSTTPAPLPWLGATPKRIAVLGDVILDEYLEGQVNRISPEAPVPVHLVTNSFFVPGGGANAARNVQGAGGHALVFGAIGQDEAGRRLCEIMRNDGIDASHVVAVDDRPTVRKTRITASNHQLVRVDWERVHPIGLATQEDLIGRLRGSRFDALLISDYGKGTLPINLLSQAIGLATERGVPVVVDPKGRDYGKYLHATLVTPNRKEACDALGLDPLDGIAGDELGRRLQRVFGLRNILVTLGPKGMILVPDGGGAAVSLPAIAREVYDVSGAGDTVVAVMTLALAAGAPLPLAMRLATSAAAIVVGKWGTQPILLHELEAALRQQPERAPATSTVAKIKTRETLRPILKDPKTRHRQVVFTNGCFDLVHAGHVSYLEEARALGDLLVVGVNTDESVRELKGPSRPIVSLEHRMRMLAALACVDYVVPFHEPTPLELITALLPDVLVKGADWAKDAIVGGDVVEREGGVVSTIRLVPGLSTTKILERIAAGASGAPAR
jgi:D-beta-D-heptose 7-phosphate kinase/D-beta-D-heptose 1-phosphate adenosyltransferase